MGTDGRKRHRRNLQADMADTNDKDPTPNQPIPRKRSEQEEVARREFNDFFIQQTELALRPIYPVLANTVLKAIPDDLSGKTVVDLGGGVGLWGDTMLEHGLGTAILVDEDDDMATYAKTVFGDPRKAGNRLLVRGRAEAIPLREGSVDLIVSRNSMHLWHDIPQAWMEIGRVLAPGGWAFLGRGFGPDLPAAVRDEVKEKREALCDPRNIEEEPPSPDPGYTVSLAERAGLTKVALIPDHKAWWILVHKQTAWSEERQQIPVPPPPPPLPDFYQRNESAFLKTVFWMAWAFLLGSVIVSLTHKPPQDPSQVPFLLRWALAGSRELFTFLAEHLVSAMIPAFFLAAAITTFLSKQTVMQTMGRDSNPFIAYPIASLAGAVLTACSCGVLPIFMSVLQNGAGLGPAVTFLYASPAINPISLIYTWKILPMSMLIGRIVSVMASSILIGMTMSFLFRHSTQEPDLEPWQDKEVRRTVAQEGVFFFLLVLVMLTSTDALKFLTQSLIPPSLFGQTDPDWSIRMAALSGKLLMILGEVVLLALALRSWFSRYEIKKWLQRTGRQARDILPMVILGVFFSGMLGGAPAMVDYLSLLNHNTFSANLVASVIGGIMYFGSIVGVNIVGLFLSWGTALGPAMALLLSGPCISLPSILALMPIFGRWKTLTYAFLVVLFSALAGYLFGLLAAG